MDGSMDIYCVLEIQRRYHLVSQYKTWVPNNANMDSRTITQESSYNLGKILRTPCKVASLQSDTVRAHVLYTPTWRAEVNYEILQARADCGSS